MLNQLKTGLLLGGLTAIVLLFGSFFGKGGLIIAFLFAIAMNVGSYWFSDRLILTMQRAREVSRKEQPELYRIVEDLAHRAEIPMPRVYIVPDPSPNAFATGRNPQHGVVAVTEGILKLLSADELRGVIAHELSHVRNRDILIQTITATLAGAIMFISQIVQFTAMFGGLGGDDDEGNPLILLAMAITAPIAAMIIQMAISRSREYLADQSGARVAGDPNKLADALEKLDAYSRQVPLKNAHSNTSHLFIVNPFSKKGLANLFSTHPPMDERIQRLRGMHA